MDLPPPPPSQLFRHQNHLHFRYENLIHPTDLIPPTFSHHLRSQPPPHHIANPSLPSFTTFLPTHHSIHEFDPPPKPYLDRISHDLPDQNPIFENDIYRRRTDSFIDRLPPENLLWGAREVNTEVSDIGDLERYGSVLYRSDELHKERDDEEMRFDNSIIDRAHRFYNEREGDVESRRAYGIKNRGCELYSEGDYNQRIRRGSELYIDRDDDQMRLGYGINDRGCELYNERDDDQRILGCGVNYGVSELYNERRPGYHIDEMDDDVSRLGYSKNEGVWLRLENRQREFSDSDLGLGRFSGRLGRGASNEHFNRSKKNRGVQKMSALDRIGIGKACRRPRRVHNRRHVSRKSSSISFRGKEKQNFKRLDTRMEYKKGREQSPMELDISFKSNALVAKAILAPASPAVNLDMDLMQNNSIRKVNSITCWPLSKPNKDMVQSDVLTRGSDLRPGLNGTSDDLLGNPIVFGNVSVATDDANDLGEKAAENEPFEVRPLLSNYAESGQTSVRRVKKRRGAKKQLLHGISHQMTNTFNHQYAVRELHADTTLSKSNKAPDINFLPSTGYTTSKKVEADADFSKSFSPKKRKRSSLTTMLASPLAADHMITNYLGHTERVVTTTKDAVHGCQFGTDEVVGLANETSLANENIGCGDGLGFYQHSDDTYKFARGLGTDKVDVFKDHPFQDGLVLLGNAIVKEPFEVMVSTNSIGSSSPPETGISDFHEDKYLSEIHESCAASDSDCSLLEKEEIITSSDVGSADANSQETFRNQANTPQTGLNAAEIRSFDGAAVADCSNVSLDTASNSEFIMTDHKGITAEFNVSFPDTMSKKSHFDGANLLHKNGSAGGYLDVISIDHSSKILRKRKAREVQMCLSGTKTNECLYNLDVEVAKVLTKGLISAAEVDFPCERDSCEKDNSLSEGPSAVEDSSLYVDFGADSSFNGFRNKRKIVSPRLTPSHSEDDSFADSRNIDCSKIDQGSSRLPELEVGQRVELQSAASTSTNKCGTEDMKVKVGSEDFFVSDMDKTLTYVNELHVKDDLSFIQDLSSCSGKNVVCIANSGSELTTSDSDVPSCVGSPEDFLLSPDFSFPINPAASPTQSRNGLICGTDKTSNRRHVSADPSTLSHGKSLENATSDNPHTNVKIAQSMARFTSKAVQKSNPSNGKSTLIKNQLTSSGRNVFTRLPINTSRNFPSTHVTKSRTWSRTANSSVAAIGPKLQSCPLPQSHAAKMPIITQSSYIRKGNSLVRKPSPSSATAPEFHATSSLVYRSSPCIDKSQESNSKVDGVDDPSLTRVERVFTSARPEELSLNHSQKLLKSTDCNLLESLPVSNSSRNGFPRSLDVLDETTKPCATPGCQDGSSNHSDSQSTVEEGNSGKRITYVKRRSNQLVAASDSQDAYMSSVDKTQSSLSGDYYKSRKNQLVRSSLEKPVKKGIAMVDVNSGRLQGRTSRSSSKRQSGTGPAKTYGSSKFSSVWKLHDAHLAEKANKPEKPQKLWPHLFPWKRATYRRNLLLALGSKTNNSSFSISQKSLLSSKRGAVYTRSTHGYSLRMSKVLSVGGSSLKWSKSIERNSKKANEEATRAVAAAEKRKKELPIISKSRNHILRKLVPSVKLRPGERIFRIGSERYKMDSTRRTLHRISAEEKSLPSVVLQSEKNIKRSYVPRRLFIGNDEYVRIGNGNQLVRDPKKRTRVLASEKVRWSLRTARLRLARKKKYCQFFTKFGKCNKGDGKCSYIHDSSKIVVCSKFLNGSCSDPDCKLTHKVIPERMQDCSYFLKGSCCKENCPYRHVIVNPNSSVCESFMRGYCAAGNECPKKHTYVCPAFEATGICAEASTCKLHHPKKKTEKKHTSEQKIVRGRYFDGGLIGVPDCEMATSEKLSVKGKEDIVLQEGKYPDYISLDVSDDEVETEPIFPCSSVF
ncbi:hypothetical protein RD792_000797 [Penstemon davidsonii]|uniref:C3H1-type domain-containing protein n=1 Tax=Penstemon davidsonii TaxID=160366 RepID=A0ABR0DLQ1_9LAMI|nr:hypothetical protein RD792_000797 [Penstemon davidsonii]